MERIGEIIGDPVEGRHYLVPTVSGEWRGRKMNWPIHGPLHTDKQFFDFEYKHYHPDFRFVPDRWLPAPSFWSDYSVMVRALAAPLMISDRINSEGFGEPVFRRRKCQRARINMDEFRAGAFVPLTQMSNQYQRALKGPRGWICPHKKYDLAAVSPDENGHITCPMHGMRFCNATGITIPPEAAEDAA